MNSSFTNLCWGNTCNSMETCSLLSDDLVTVNSKVNYCEITDIWAKNLLFVLLLMVKMQKHFLVVLSCQQMINSGFMGSVLTSVFSSFCSCQEHVDTPKICLFYIFNNWYLLWNSLYSILIQTTFSVTGKPQSIENTERVQLSGTYNVRKGKLQLPVNRWTRRQVILCGTCLIVSSVKESQTGKMHILPLIGGKVCKGYTTTEA